MNKNSKEGHNKEQKPTKGAKKVQKQAIMNKIRNENIQK